MHTITQSSDPILKIAVISAASDQGITLIKKLQDKLAQNFSNPMEGEVTSFEEDYAAIAMMERGIIPHVFVAQPQRTSPNAAGPGYQN